jgi:hypothetical protein
MTQHPLLPAGYNADPIDGFEIDSPGTNWAVWPTLYDTFISLEAIIITQEMMDAFGNLCPDYAPTGEDMTAIARGIYDTYVVPAIGWPHITVEAVNSTYMIAGEYPVYVIRADKEGITISEPGNVVPMQRGVRAQQMRKRA